MTDRPVTRHTIFQNSLMTALLDGIYDGEMTVGELLGKGNFGLGTFDALDGEMVIIDGTCYQLRHDGSAVRADLEARSPYAVATNFVPRIRRRAPENIRRSELSDFIDEMTPSENYMYAVRITGRFSDVTTRTVVRQSKPYPPMTEAVGDDAEQHFTDDGRIVGGHVLDFTLAEGKIELCPGTDLDLRLPLTSTFSSANLDPDDLDDQLHATEVKD